ncbi:zyxin-like [Convolutriloba macropyga]|uniref:zyxin-like n=1 Tax=Convolutriloba macropyga TaxID=536237 RepID=UPI003F522743
MEELNAMSANKDTPKCQICNQYCMGTNVVETKDVTSGEVLFCHSTCFNCLECGTSLADQRCYRDPSDPINSRYCLQCYSGGSQTVPRLCSACSLPFKSDFISLPNNRGHFHPSCLNCALCRVNLVDKPMLFDKTKGILKCSPPCDLFLT